VLLPQGAGLVLEQVQLCGEIVQLVVRCAATGATCPGCGRRSEAVHGTYARWHYRAERCNRGRRHYTRLA
jgi:transposase